MPLPFSSSGTIELKHQKKANLERVTSDIFIAIKACEPTSITMINGGIIFKAGIFRLVGSWNQLIYIGSGQISFSQKQEHILIHYRISFLQWFLLTSVMSMLVWILTASLGTTVLAWMIIFLGNSGYAHYRFTRFLIKAASSKSAPSS